MKTFSTLHKALVLTTFLLIIANPKDFVAQGCVAVRQINNVITFLSDSDI